MLCEKSLVIRFMDSLAEKNRVMKIEFIQQESTNKLKPKLVRITKESGVPLIGALGWGIIDRGTNLLQVRCTTICNAKCSFCSTAANDFKVHPTNYIVNIDYLVEEVEKVVKFKGSGLIIFLDSVGEPMSHPHFVELVKKLKLIREVKEIITITNGTFLTKDKIDSLKEAGLTRVNLSLHSLNPGLSKRLFGMNSYDIEKIKEIIYYIKEKGLDLMLTPVYLYGVNDNDVEEIIKFVKEVGCKAGLQKYETYKYSRKMKGVKKQTYWKFYKQVDEWEKKYDIKLRYSYEDLGIEKRQRIPEIFNIGDKIDVEIVCPGWMEGQMIGKSNSRCISINNCEKSIGERVRVKILQNKNNIYLAE